MNRLSGEKAAYLKLSAKQKIDWHPWSEEAFQRAKAEDRPVFLSSGGAWCHWCHVMAEECFEDDEVVRLLNDNFVSVKIDRDERPDIDRRYQIAVAAMGSGGGWPLSVFLTPDKKPFFGGTYFPPEDMDGRPGFKRVLRSVAEFYRTRRQDVEEYTGRLMGALSGSAPASDGDISLSAASAGVSAVLEEFDPQSGGFGTAPKFPMPGAIELLLAKYMMDGRPEAGLAVRKTLEAMASGGFRDHVGGGFHRYSVDAEWRIPHFEKMSEDNAWLLRNYVKAYACLGDERFKTVAEGIIVFIKEDLSYPEGGFYASLDADITPRDEGGYFTWTDGDFKSALSDEEYRAIGAWLMSEKGAMRHNPEKIVLFPAMSADEAGKQAGIPQDRIISVIESGMEKLRAVRRKRQKPFTDTSIYTSLNGLMITAHLCAYRILGDEYLRDFALKSLRRVEELNFRDGLLYHSGAVEAMLDDYVHLAEAFASAYEVTGDAAYLRRAEDLVEKCAVKLWDEAGGFYDSSGGGLGIILKNMEDVPHPSANSCAIALLVRLFHITGNSRYTDMANRALKFFLQSAKDMGIHGAYYYFALYSYYETLSLRVDARPGGVLASAALSLSAPFSAISYGRDEGRIVLCLRKECYEPVYDSEGLKKLKETLWPQE